MLISKTFRYRIYPTSEQIDRLNRWDGSLRYLWNLANEQRLIGLSRPSGERIYPSAFDQINELKEIRAANDWLADVPRDVQARLLVDLDQAWQRCFKGLADRPRWKAKNRDQLSFCEPHPKSWSLSGNTLTFPKLGDIPVRQHRSLEGIHKTCRIVRDVDQWFVCISCDVTIPDPVRRAEEPIIGLDRGAVNLIADSQGNLIENPRFLHKSQRKIARAQRALERKQKGSASRKKARVRLARLHRKVRRQRDHLLHQISNQYSKNHGRIAVERLQLKSMMKSASGTVEKPGRNVRQKAGLNRALQDSALGRLLQFLGYKQQWSGGFLILVWAAYTSLMCRMCRYTDRKNRPTQDLFCCQRCGHTEHADVNAAHNIMERAHETWVKVCGGIGALDSHLLLDVRLTLPVKQKLRVVRRGSRSKGSEPKAPIFRPE